MSAINIFDFIIIACGVYMAVSGILMKTKGKINTGLVLTRGMTEDQIRDKEGFINFMWSKLMVLGIVCALSGAANIVCSMIDGLGYVDLILNAVFFVILIVYWVIVSKAQKQYLS